MLRLLTVVPAFVFMFAFAFVFMFAFVFAAAHAQDYPARPIRFIVPFPPGGGAELFKSAVGVDIVHVPYKGNGPMTAAVLGGEVNLVFDSMTGPLPHIRAGKLRAVGITSKARVPVLPDVPTVAETLVPDFEYVAWNGVLAPAGTPREAVQKLARAIADAVATPEARERLTGAGYVALSATPEEFGARIAADLARFGKVIRDVGIKAD